MTLRAVHRDQEDLMRELERVRQRPTNQRFAPAQGSARPLDLKVLPGVAARLYPDQWRNEAERGKLIHAALRHTIARLPEEKFPGTPDSSEMTWRQAALILYDLATLRSDVVAMLNRYDEPQWHAKLSRYVRTVAGYQFSDEAFKDVNRRMREELAAIMLAEETDDEPEETLDHRGDGEDSAEVSAAQGNHRTIVKDSFGVQVGNENTLTMNFGDLPKKSDS
ncbi:RIP homotypic interaction motif-containing protein [Nocardia brasiliensis]|uniref:RIP homotypic interaction motif-containing protein n=1 Tax=Nocardia brasiliensis TaxID=37326 RepID=UPI001893D5ED|nr:RIP homotypic interaction motif-containing protein [Nocardia brasiliensis]MBF6546960.1 hypothetical protein [Nocardia brasiliensis]